MMLASDPRSEQLIELVTRYRHLCDALAEAERVVSSIADEKGVCAAQLHAAGWPLTRIAAELGCGTRARVQQLIRRGRTVLEKRDNEGETVLYIHFEISCDYDDCFATYRSDISEVNSRVRTSAGAKRAGWTHRFTKDYCPRHADAAAKDMTANG